MKKTIHAYLRDIGHELDDIVEFTREGQQAFLQDARTQKAVLRSYEVIGEIVKRLPVAFRADHTEIDWNQLASFRDFLAHNCEEIIFDFVWKAVEDVPRLRGAIEGCWPDRTSMTATR